MGGAFRGKRGQVFIGTDLVQLFGKTLGRDVVMLNDADAAGLAEGEYGAGRNVPGSVMTLTLGTGIGSALLFNGQLVPNFELGHLEFNGAEAEPPRAPRHANARSCPGTSTPSV